MTTLTDVLTVSAAQIGLLVCGFIIYEDPMACVWVKCVRCPLKGPGRRLHPPSTNSAPKKLGDDALKSFILATNCRLSVLENFLFAYKNTRFFFVKKFAGPGRGMRLIRCSAPYDSGRTVLKWQVAYTTQVFHSEAAEVMGPAL